MSTPICFTAWWLDFFRSFPRKRESILACLKVWVPAFRGDERMRWAQCTQPLTEQRDPFLLAQRPQRRERIGGMRARRRPRRQGARLGRWRDRERRDVDDWFGDGLDCRRSGRRLWHDRHFRNRRRGARELQRCRRDRLEQ